MKLIFLPFFIAVVSLCSACNTGPTRSPAQMHNEGTIPSSGSPYETPIPNAQKKKTISYRNGAKDECEAIAQRLNEALKRDKSNISISCRWVTTNKNKLSINDFSVTPLVEVKEIVHRPKGTKTNCTQFVQDFATVLEDSPLTITCGSRVTETLKVQRERKKRGEPDPVIWFANVVEE